MLRHIKKAILYSLIQLSFGKIPQIFVRQALLIFTNLNNFLHILEEVGKTKFGHVKMIQWYTLPYSM